MAPNNKTEFEMSTPTGVGFFEPENEKQYDDNIQKKKIRMVPANGLAFQGSTKDLPEQGSWHYNRKKEMLKKYPQLRELFGTNPWTALIWCIPATLHVLTAIYLRNSPWYVVLPIAYTWGALLHWQCGTLAHEGAHGLVFENRFFNKLFTCCAFLPCMIGPFGNFWSIEHMYHHQVVVDKMNRYGAQQNGFFVKVIATSLWMPVLNTFFTITSLIVFINTLINMALYAVGKRPTLYPTQFKLPPYRKFPQIVSHWFMFNTLLCIAFNGFLYTQFGLFPIGYLLLSACCTNGVHPLGMRQVQEHYLQRRDQPTNSVYSPFSTLLFNLGIHVEHHDFPTIPWNRLPQIRKIAPEFYNNLFFYNSYTEVFIDFFTRPGIPITVLLEDVPGYETSGETKKSN